MSFYEKSFECLEIGKAATQVARVNPVAVSGFEDFSGEKVNRPLLEEFLKSEELVLAINYDLLVVKFILGAFSKKFGLFGNFFEKRGGFKLGRCDWLERRIEPNRIFLSERAAFEKKFAGLDLIAN